LFERFKRIGLLREGASDRNPELIIDWAGLDFPDFEIARLFENAALLRLYGPVRVEVVLRIIPGFAQTFDTVSAGRCYSRLPCRRT
jgi:hypothetical protein